MCKSNEICDLCEIIAKGLACPEKPECAAGTCPDCIALDVYSKGYRQVPHARWKGAGFGDYYCSLCASEYSGADEFNFCPNCGADMR